jgi:two-component system phosphate regulon response regulator OmpR
MAKILLIDDDLKLLDLFQRYLTQFGQKVEIASSPREGLAKLTRDGADLVVLDVMMPEKSGFDLCREIRATSRVPIIMMTARGDVSDRVVGLELGADDYVVKPVDPRELLARIESVLRRSRPEATPAPQASFGDLEVDLATRSARLAGVDVRLSTTEFQILELFVRNPGRVLSRDELLESLRGIEWEAENRSVDVLVSRLRQKLKDDPKAPRFFKTVWGSGYLFIGDKKIES